MSSIVDESSCSIEYTSRDTSSLALSSAVIDDTTLNGCQQYDQCYHGDKNDKLDVLCHENNINVMKDDIAEEPSKQTRGGASRLRQQWAKHTQPKLHVSDPECTRENEDKDITTERQQSDPVSITRTPPPSSSSSQPPTKKLIKTQSVGSISSESLTISSLWEAPSYDTIPDFLSSLGFDDFDSPELIPDRFIPPELDFVRPSLMRQATLGSVDDGQPSLSPDDELMLGASADIITQQQQNSIIQDNDKCQHIPPQTLALYLPSNSQLPWQPASLETVIEETTSELLSPRPSSRQSHHTPHIQSPLLSIDHTPTQEAVLGHDGDISTGLLGAGIAQRLRQQLLTRDDLRQRQTSLGAESDTSSIYFSVGSHFEDSEKDNDDIRGSGSRKDITSSCDVIKDGSIDETDNTCRRRRRGNYNMPPPQILMWLEKTESHTVNNDITDQPWPFSESPSPGLPSITLNENCNNNNEEIVSERPIITENGSVLTNDRGGSTLTDNILTSAYHQASHTPT